MRKSFINLIFLQQARKAIYTYRSGYLQTLSKDRYTALTGTSTFVRLSVLFSRMLEEIKLNFSKNSNFLNLDNKIIAIVGSRNTFHTMSFLRSSENIEFISVNGGKFDIAIPEVRFKKKFWYSLLFLFYIPRILFSKDRDLLLLLHQAFGSQDLFVSFLKKHNPKAVVFSNDHSPNMRSYILACKQLNIPTIYLQHASVSKYFPPLIFDLSLLDSQNTFDIYKSIAPIQNKVEFVGLPKLDQAIKNRRQRTKIKRIGIAVNQNDNLSIVSEVCQHLYSDGFELTIRMHPLDKRKLQIQGDFNDGNSIDLFTFLNSIDFLIATDSSIHVEANSIGCRSVYFRFHHIKDMVDYYGYVRQGYVDDISDYLSLKQYLVRFDYSSFDFSSDVMRYYNSSLGTDYYGNSGERVKNILNENFNN